jgi:hypothetical protein
LTTQLSERVEASREHAQQGVSSFKQSNWEIFKIRHSKHHTSP